MKTHVWSSLIAFLSIFFLALSTPAYDPLPGPSPYGPDDEAGATNTQTPAKAKEMALEVLFGEGKVYRLGHEYENEMPAFPGSQGWDLSVPPETYVIIQSQVAIGDLFHGNIGQQGTQLDALAHFGYLPVGLTDLDEVLYFNQFTGAEVIDENGFQHLGVENLKPMVTRGILLDVRRWINEGEPLARGVEITMEMIDETLAAQGLTRNDVKKGDAVMINTGHEEFWELGTVGYYLNPSGGGLAEAGIGLEVAQWLASRQVTVVGSDNWGIEVAPNPNPPVELGILFPVHHELIIKNGIPLQESMHLGDLAEDVGQHYQDLLSAGIPRKLAGQTAYVFAYIYTPVPIKGGSGSPGVPIAIR